ncbi:T9SS type A sorting domain-containing protein [Flavobacterium phycosphaerae]|uniref:T9SS type A sorting domain-containing protein n=1 Tax=Flavobacterium phycosphaerae TaxID=2697515 RepID=UPI001F23AAB0|nr:T9SS type A sorting domain-containing protein [Flavobacterium phycosphaerae]
MYPGTGFGAHGNNWNSRGNEHSVFVKDDGTAWATGYNYFGGLGDGTTVDKSTPVQVQGLSGITAVAAGRSHSLFLKSDGTAWAVGYNGNGQLGDGTTVNKITAVQVPNQTGIVAIASGEYHCLFLKNDNTVWGVGLNDPGQLGDGTITTRINPIQIPNICSVSLGVAENPEDNTVAVYPVPCTDRLFIYAEEYQDTTAEIFNLQGQLIQSMSLKTNKTELQIIDFKSGIYFVQVKNSKGMIVKKILKN